MDSPNGRASTWTRSISFGINHTSKQFTISHIYKPRDGCDFLFLRVFGDVKGSNCFFFGDGIVGDFAEDKGRTIKSVRVFGEGLSRYVGYKIVLEEAMSSESVFNLEGSNFLEGAIFFFESQSFTCFLLVIDKPGGGSTVERPKVAGLFQLSYV